MTFHFIGIGGAGMSVIAELFLSQGRSVQGSDRSSSAITEHLEAHGARIWIGHDAANVAGLGPKDTIVTSTAIREDNPELRTARAAGVGVIHRSQALALAAQSKDFIAVAGSHGKTSTSAMLAFALRQVGADPSFAVGGRINGIGSGGGLGSSSIFVAEADESDNSFLNYAPQTAIVTNVEADHLDQHGTPAAYARAFERFADRIVPGGLLIAGSDDPGARALAHYATGAGIRVRTYGTDPGADVRIEVTRLGPGSAGARLTSDLGALELDLAVPGEHNLHNATAAWCAGVEAGIDPASMAAALGDFAGTGRRFELRGEIAGVRVIDDYAHNPTKVAAAVRTATGAADGGRVIAVFQPHLFSRTKDFAREFAAGLDAADEVILAPIYPAREDPIPGVDSTLIAQHLPRARVLNTWAELAQAAADGAQAGDLIITIGAGDITTLPQHILAALEQR